MKTWFTVIRVDKDGQETVVEEVGDVATAVSLVRRWVEGNAGKDPQPTEIVGIRLS